MNSLNFGSLTGPRLSLGAGMRMRPKGMPRMSMGMGRGMGMPSMGGLGVMRLASGGLAEGGNPSMSWLAVRDGMRAMPRHIMPDYMLARMADGGGVDDVMSQMRRRHGVGGAFRGIDGDAPMRTMLENDPMSWWNEDVPRERDLYKALGARSPGMSMSPGVGNDITQSAIDKVHGPGAMRMLLESLLGDNPSSASLAFSKGWVPGPRLGGLSMMLSSGDAGAASDETRPRDFEGYGKYQPFRALKESIR